MGPAYKQAGAGNVFVTTKIRAFWTVTLRSVQSNPSSRSHAVSYVKLFFQNCLHDKINLSNFLWIKESNSFTSLIIFSKLSSRQDSF